MTTMPPEAETSKIAKAQRDASAIDWLLVTLADLRLTVVLFALLIFVVFTGTLAQVDHDVWFVVNEGYFRVWFAWIELQGFVRLAEMFTKAEAQPVTGGFWFPGGKLIGCLMFANLLAAHAIRFKVAARGSRLTTGLVLLGAGVLTTFWVLAAGMDQSLKGQLSSDFCSNLWEGLRAALAASAVGAIFWTASARERLRPAEWWIAAVCSATLGVLAGYLYANPSIRPDDAGMRIVWELTKCGGAAALTFGGCWLVFKQRAGIVLLHAGVGLLMVGELVTDLYAQEGRMDIPEGETVNYVFDIRTAEFAVTVDEGDADRVTVVPAWRLQAAAVSGEPISHPDLPFDLLVKRYFKNADLISPKPEEPNLATQGAGMFRIAEERRGSSGVDAKATVDVPAAYVELLEKDSGDSLGVWLAGVDVVPQKVDSAQPAEIALRFKRTYKPYSLTLTDFRFERYVGTEIPKDFSSHVILQDSVRSVDMPVRIWMNNPLRYAGDTIYQSSFDSRTEATTVLQVVTNGGWMIPYVSCMFVGLGMLVHFGVTLRRFTRRRVEEAARLAKQATEPAHSEANLLSVSAWRKPAVWAPALAALVALGYFGSKARPSSAEESLQQFGMLPVAEGGRIKPFDTLARTTLQSFSSRQEVIPAEEGTPNLLATEWLLDTLSKREGWDDHPVFRIENLELLEALGLPPRPGSFRYSYAEVMADPERTQALFRQAFQRSQEVRSAEEAGEPIEPLTRIQERTLRLAGKIQRLDFLAIAFQTPQIGGADEAAIREQLGRAQALAERLRRLEAVRAVPPAEAEGEWLTLYEANFENLLRLAMRRPVDAVAVAMDDALRAHAAGDTSKFAEKLIDLEAAAEKHQRALEDSPETLERLARSERLDVAKVRFESFFNAFSPVYYCAAMYVVAFVLTALGWLGQGGAARAFGRSANAVLLVTLLVHTLALLGRIYISGRPPVTNLYSSAVFIGWGAVLLGLAIEAIYRLSVGSAVASVIGFATTVVAYNLSLEGDTFTVLRAVLDTQFWLATHVVCITLGYSTTYLAGFLGIAYLFAASAPRLLGLSSRVDKRAADQLIRMIYGSLCFALLFSFVGTVLGGLWADDSWGRFWGWDPKENGALIIVLWNALVLHARWGKMIGPVGLATLAVGGNIVTTWSWFGVNELGVGLHAYGDSESSTATWLFGFAASQLAIILIGCVAPKPRLAS